MAAYFFDTSALAKAYLPEVGTSWVREVVAPVSGNEVYLSRMTLVELTSAVIRGQKAGRLSSPDSLAILEHFRQEARDEFFVVGFSAELRVIQNAIRLVEAYALRAYDAVQLATAQAMQRKRASLGLSDLTFVSSDFNLNLAATAEGLVVANPLDQS